MGRSTLIEVHRAMHGVRSSEVLGFGSLRAKSEPRIRTGVRGFRPGGEGKREQNDDFFQIFCAKSEAAWVPELSFEARKPKKPAMKTQNPGPTPKFLGPLVLNGRSLGKRLKKGQSRYAP